MFFLTKNLKEILSRESLSEKSSMCDTDFSNITLRTTQFILVKIVKMVILGEKHYGCKLYDGIDIINCVIHKDNYRSSIGNELIVGNILHFNEYSFVYLKDLASLNKSQISEEDDKKVLNLFNWHLVGMCSYQNLDEKKVEKNLNKINLSEKKENFLVGVDKECSCININLLSSTLNKKVWKIQATLKKIGSLREFKKTNGDDGANLRLLFQDKSGFTEISAFNELISKVENLEIDKVYEISQGCIKYAKKSCLEWSSQFGLVPFEIVVTKETIINPSSIEESSLEQSVSNTQDQSEELCQNLSQDKINEPKNDNNQLIKDIYKKKNLIPLNHLMLRNVNDSINVVGIVNEIDSKTKKIVKHFKPLSVRNFSLIDKSDISVKVALWGNEAETCKFECGQILMLIGCVITNFGGISLSVVRATKIFNLTEEHDLPIVKDLEEWLINKKTKDKNKIKRKLFDMSASSSTNSKKKKFSS